MLKPTIFAALLICSTALADPSTQPAYTTDPGPIPIQILPIRKLHDAARNKDLDIRIILPTDQGPYPVILFSHGAGGSPGTYLDTLKLWASRGYVVIAPVHDDSLMLRHLREGMGQDELSSSGYAEEMRQAFDAALYDQTAWVNRVKDMELILDKLKNLPDRIPQLRGQMDLKRIGMAGHSFGAQTTVLLAGATIDFSPADTGHSFADPRIKAAILLSGQGRDHMGFAQNSWEKIQIPMMAMTGTLDTGIGDTGPKWKMEPFQFCPPGEKFAVLVQDATHLSFCSNLAKISGETPKKEILSDIELPTLPFWDAYLKDDPAAKAYLHSDEITQSTHGQVQMWAK